MMSGNGIYHRERTSKYTFELEIGDGDFSLKVKYPSQKGVYSLKLIYESLPEVIKFSYQNLEELYEALVIGKNRQIGENGVIRLRVEITKKGATVEKWLELGLIKNQKENTEEKEKPEVQSSQNKKIEPPQPIKQPVPLPAVLSQNSSNSHQIIKTKIAFIGDHLSGKTSLITSFVSGEFKQQIAPTIGVDFISKNVVMEGSTVRLQVWDTAGQERFHSLVPSYLKDAQIILIVFSLLDVGSANNLKVWVDKVRESEKESHVVLVGNKSDGNVSQEARTIGKMVAEKEGFSYIETSAKESQNTRQALLTEIKTALFPAGPK